GWMLGDALYDFASPVNADTVLNAKWETKVETYAANFFDTATLKSKTANNAIDNAFLDSKIADNAFAADADSRGKFADGIWTIDKLAEDARTNILMVQVEGLDAGDDIASRPVFEVPTGYKATIVSAYILSQGTATGIDDSNTCVVALGRNADGAFASITYKNNPAFPASGVSGDMGTIVEDYKELVAGKKIVLSVTNGSTAKPPMFAVRIVYTLEKAGV
ncbi:MAG: hypothetical protein GXZ13_07050, partial [Synergistaceae bacterium]|nr:hypothetical protein [Synergistaceae bacterium]